MTTGTPASHSWAVRSLIRKLCNPLTLANIVAVVALFIALSATSAAATPVKVQAPSIYGDPIEGKVINCSPGFWDDTEPGSLL